MRIAGRTAAAAAVIALLAVGAGLLSGLLSLVTTFGVSMAPRMAADDLVVVRAGTYAVGDVVAYLSPELKQVVLHRIVATEGDRFVFQGDNNDFLDPERLPKSDIVGKELLHLPQGGIWLDRLTSAPTLAAYAFLLLAGGAAAATTKRQRRKERRTVSPRHRATPGRATASLPPGLKPFAAGAALVGLTGLALTGVAWSQPTSQSVDASTSVDSTMDFSYTAQVPQTAAYDGTTVTAPQPVFRTLADAVDVTYRYVGSPGSLAVDAELSAPSGWRSTIPLKAAEPVGAEHDGSVTLRLAELEQRAAEAGEVIGIPASSLTITVVPTVTIDGGGSFAPRLELALDAQSLKPAGELTATEATSTAGTRTEPNQIRALGRGLDVGTARKAGPAAALAALIAAMVLAALARLAGPVAEADRVRRRYGDLILPVMPVALAAGRPVVDVPDVGSLVKLAERYGLLVLAWSRGGVDTYVVQDEGTTFRYRSGASGTGTSVPARQEDATPLAPL